MGARLPLLVVRLAILVGLGVSSALLIDYFRPLPAFCDVGSGCAQIRASGHGSIFGVPIALLGVLGFTLLMILSLVQSERAFRWMRLLSLFAGAVGLFLLSMQAFYLKVFCKLCVAVDMSAFVAAAAVLAMRSRRDADLPAAETPVFLRWLWPAATVASLLLPGVWALIQPSPPVPPEIASLWVPNKINVVEFADFQCPFCRQIHPRVTQLLEEYAGRVNFVRLNVPLPSHAQARPAARAYCCAEDQGKGPEMADALFQTDDLTPEACEKLAASLGLSLPAYQACVRSQSTDARIDDEIQRVRKAGFAGLPTLWIGDQVVVGLQPIETLREAFAEAARGQPPVRLPTAFLWGAFTAALAVVGALAMRGIRADQGAR